MNPNPGSGSIIWANGAFTTLEECRLSPLDRGLLYADGLFETLRAEKGRILFLARHVERLLRSMAVLRLGTTGLPNWEALLPELLSRNGLGQETAAVKIIVTRGLSEGLGLPSTQHPSVFISCRRYAPPSSRSYSEGWRLMIHRDGFSPPLAMHKSLSYLFHLTARQAALDNGADEAVILDASGAVAETAAGSLLLRADGRWWTPASPCQLPGITLRAVCEHMERMGAGVERKETSIADLRAAETIHVLNSLMLVMDVQSLDGRPLRRPDPGHASLLRRRLLEGS
jgi:branched-chain amino acid aminotransferase/para-aminobenzoate synthetase component 1